MICTNNIDMAFIGVIRHFLFNITLKSVTQFVFALYLRSRGVLSITGSFVIYNSISQ